MILFVYSLVFSKTLKIGGLQLYAISSYRFAIDCFTVLFSQGDGTDFEKSGFQTLFMRQSKDNKFIPMTSVDSGKVRVLAPDVVYYTNQIVNLIMIGKPADNWVLIDAGMPKSGKQILKVAEERF